jgi:tRNA(Ile)-lysidine synthase TilS/MesJ
MEFADTDELIEKLDIEIREYLEHHQLPQWFVDEVANKYLSVTYIRKRIRELYPVLFRDIAPFFEIHDQ